MNIQELEQKYADLGEEIKKLKAKPVSNKREKAEKGHRYYTVNVEGKVVSTYEYDKPVINGDTFGQLL